MYSLRAALAALDVDGLLGALGAPLLARAPERLLRPDEEEDDRLRRATVSVAAMAWGGRRRRIRRRAMPSPGIARLLPLVAVALAAPPTSASLLHYDFVEIGTSDFDTIMQQADKDGDGVVSDDEITALRLQLEWCFRNMLC